jgi:hypothetical protein
VYSTVVVGAKARRSAKEAQGPVSGFSDGGCFGFGGIEDAGTLIGAAEAARALVAIAKGRGEQEVQVPRAFWHHRLYLLGQFFQQGLGRAVPGQPVRRNPVLSLDQPPDRPW